MITYIYRWLDGRAGIIQQSPGQGNGRLSTDRERIGGYGVAGLSTDTERINGYGSAG
jgi:hypothetical protein